MTIGSRTAIQWVRLRYRSVNQMQDFRSLTMRSRGAGGYEAAVPGEHIAGQWDFMYLIEIMDKAGRGMIYPDLQEQTPYIVVPLQRRGGLLGMGALKEYRVRARRFASLRLRTANDIGH